MDEEDPWVDEYVEYPKYDSKDFICQSILSKNCALEEDAVQL